MVGFTFRLKSFLSKVPLLSSFMSSEPIEPNNAEVHYLFPSSDIKFSVADWHSLVSCPRPNYTPYALTTYITSLLFCKDRRGVEHEFMLVSYKHFPNAPDKPFDDSTRWLRIDRCVDINREVPRELLTPGPLVSILPDCPDLGTLRSISPMKLGKYLAKDTVRVYGRETPPWSLVRDTKDDDPDVRIIGRREFPPATLPIYFLAAAVFEMSLSVPMYDTTKSQCYWHAATIWKLLDEEFQSGNTTLSDEDIKEIERINKFTFDLHGRLGFIKIPYMALGRSLKLEVQTENERLKMSLELLVKMQKSKEQLEAERARESSLRQCAEIELQVERERAEAERTRLEAEHRCLLEAERTRLEAERDRESTERKRLEAEHERESTERKRLEAEHERESAERKRLEAALKAAMEKLALAEGTGLERDV